MSKEQEKKTDYENNEDVGQCLRGEILLSGFITKALHGKSQVLPILFNCLNQPISVAVIE